MSQATLQMQYKLDQNGSGASSSGVEQMQYRPCQQNPAQNFKFDCGDNTSVLKVGS